MKSSEEYCTQYVNFIVVVNYLANKLDPSQYLNVLKVSGKWLCPSSATFVLLYKGIDYKEKLCVDSYTWPFYTSLFPPPPTKPSCAYM